MILCRYNHRHITSVSTHPRKDTRQVKRRFSLPIYPCNPCSRARWWAIPVLQAFPTSHFPPPSKPLPSSDASTNREVAMSPCDMASGHGRHRMEQKAKQRPMRPLELVAVCGPEYPRYNHCVPPYIHIPQRTRIHQYHARMPKCRRAVPRQPTAATTVRHRHQQQ